MAKQRTASRRARRVVLKPKVADMLRWERVCRVATAGGGGMPHLVAVCHVLVRDRLYFASGADGRKMLNLRENPQLALTVDVYTDTWPQLRGVMVQGRARLIERGPAFRRIRAALYAKYPQYPREAALSPSDSTIVELIPTHVFSWGRGMD
jgi:nitroimidazol reductase NimA-like FMN-containing flavoprotein (pyridoxamine 5'-phosphate oxidase superfamily)